MFFHEEIKRIYQRENDALAEPQIYKRIKFYPILIKDHRYMNLLYNVITIPQISFSQKDPLVFKMSYLRFLLEYLPSVYKENNVAEDINIQLRLLLAYVTKTTDIFIGVDKDTIPDYPMLYIEITQDDNKARFSEGDFDNIREIILLQNNLSWQYVEDYNPELEKYYQIKLRISGNPDLDFSDQLFYFAALLNKPIDDDIKNTSFYQMAYLNEAIQRVHFYERHFIDLTNTGKEYKYDHFAIHMKPVSGRYDSILQKKSEFEAQTNIEITK